MMLLAVNGLDLAVQRSGAGEPLVLVHGAWTDRTGWMFVEEELAGSYHVVSYDRRGHSTSSPVPGTRRDHEDDLAALIEHLGLGPTNLVGNSFGGSIALALAARRPDLVRSVCVHEPPVTDLCVDDAAVGDWLDPIHDRVLPLIERGENAAAAQAFINDVALGPGAWDLVPPRAKATMANNASTFLQQMQDPNWASLDVAALAGSPAPMMLTHGGQSPPAFERIVDAIRTSIPQMRLAKIGGAGHLPHVTNVSDWLDVVRPFIDEN